MHPLLPQDWGSQPPPKTSVVIISGMGKATDFKLGRYIHRIYPNKSPLEIFGEKGSVGVLWRDCPDFLGTPIISGMGKATNFKFGPCIHRAHPNKSLLKFLDKRERGHIQGLPNFWGTPYYLRHQ